MGLQYDVELVQKIEALLGHQLAKAELDEKAVLAGLTRVLKARRLASMAAVEEETRLESRGGVPIRKRRRQRRAEAGGAEE